MNVSDKIFHRLDDLTKYKTILNTTERILYECPLILKIGESGFDSEIKFLRLYETFMITSIVYFLNKYYFSFPFFVQMAH